MKGPSPGTTDLLIPLFVVLLLLGTSTKGVAANTGSVKPVVTGNSQSQGAGPQKASPRQDGLVFVTGVPSVIELHTDLRGDASPVCVDFTVGAIGKAITEVHVTSVGVAGARLEELKSPAVKQDCEETGRTGAARVVLKDMSADERLMRLFIPTHAFPEVPEGGSGKLTLVSLDAPAVQQEFLLRRQEHSYKALLVWLLGVLTPVAIAAIGYLLKNAYEGRKERRKSLEDFRRLRADKLLDLFGTARYKVVTTASDNNYAEAMERELKDHSIFDGLTADQVRDLRRALSGIDRKEVGNILAKAFPDYADAIRAAH